MSRFKPRRAGIIRLWDYDAQEFFFADGRLVLRGANGSGKTKALEVLFPFVLDGRMDPHRLDPFSGEERSMKKNLLFRGEKAGYGYAWMEFAHGDERVTVGVGMQAREEGSVKSWFFVTDRPLPEHGGLLDAEHRPLSRTGLIEAVGAEAVFERAIDYRAAIDARLFGLGAERYEAMLDLVLTLRRPQLAKALKLESLSRTLSDGLRPLDDQLIRDAAQAFEDLEKVQRDLDKLARADQTLDELTAAYRTYLGSHAAARAEVWIERERRAANATYDVEARERDLQRARDTLGAAEAVARSLEADRSAEDARHKVLINSDAYREIGRLDELRARAKSEAAGARQLDGLIGGQRRASDRAAAELASAQADRQAVVARQDGEIRSVQALAVQASIDIDVTADVATWSAAPRARWIELDEVFGLLRSWEQALEAERREADEVEQAEKHVADAASELHAREAAAEAAMARLVDALGTWAPDLADDADRQALLARLSAEDDERTLQEIARQRFEERSRALRRAEEAAEREIDQLQARIDEIAAQIERIHAETDDAPAPLPFRGASRAGRRGAPLWRTVRFADHLDVKQQIGLEGALEASGLLDAWLDPDDVPVSGAVHDAFLAVRPPVAGPSLADWLVPEPDGDVPAEWILAWLRSVSATTVQIDGRFDLGPVRGAWTPLAPRFIGATARAQHRARRIAELTDERNRVAHARSESLAHRDESRDRVRAMDDAIRSVPSLSPWTKAKEAVGAAQQRWTVRREALIGRQERHGRAQRETAQRYQHLRATAQHRAAPFERAALEGLRGVVQSLVDSVARAGRGATEVRSASRRCEEAGERARIAASTLEQGEQQLAAARATADVSASALQIAESLSGQSVQQVLNDVRDVESRLTALIEREKGAREVHLGAVKAFGRCESDALSSRDKQAVALHEFEGASQRLAVFSISDLAEILGVPAGDGDFATRLVPTVAGFGSSEPHRKSSRTRVDRLLQTLDNDLGADYHPAWNTEDDVLTIAVEDGGGKRPIGEFGRGIKRQLAEQRELLTAREQALFEDHLLGSLVDQLRERISAARTLVKHMDDAMHGRRMSSGHSVGVSWARDPDAIGADAEVLNLLERAAVHLGDADRARLRRHFADLVKGARSIGLEKPYQQILATALDYRRWFRFDLTVVEPDGKKGRLTAQRYAQLSGGEKSASLHMPLFAAAHAHFNSARSTCPRLVALDEAFAGIDDTGRPELTALTVAFDLDLFMTGFDLWVTDPSVPAIAHYDLLHDRDNHAVSAWLIVWNGRETVEGEGAEAALWP